MVENPRPFPKTGPRVNFWGFDIDSCFFRLADQRINQIEL